MPPERNRSVFAITIVFAALVGIALRWYLLKDQVFADDEWHGFYYAIGKSPFWLLTHFSIPGATCIPLNFYTWVLGATVGWSEILLRLPSVVAGVLCVIVCPFLARPLVGTRTAGWLALFLAISPLLIFYSRIARPYSAVAFLAFASVLFAARWAQSGGWRWGALFASSAVLAIYFHLFAIVTAAAPILATLVYCAYRRFSSKQGISLVKPPLGHWLIAGLAIVGLSALLLAAAMLHSMRTTFFNIAFTGTFRLNELPRVMMLIAGTHESVLMALFWAAAAWGAVRLCRRNPWFGGILVGLYPLHILALLLSRPDSAQSAIVLLRYSIPMVPATLLLAAEGIQAALEAIANRTKFSPGLQVITVCAWTAALLAAGPLPQCYVFPNNFTSHGAFQHNYEPIDWNRSFRSDLTPPGFTLNTVITSAEVSPFYKLLGQTPGSRPIVEYPMMIGDHFNPLYYYQHFHKRPVIVGYATDVKLPASVAAGNVYGDTYIDQVLSLVPDLPRLRFRNLINMDDLAAMRARHVQYIILHRRFEAQLQAVAFPLPDLARLDRKYRKEIGPPVYEDAHIEVFRL